MSKNNKNIKRMPKHAKLPAPPKEMKRINWGVYYTIMLVVLIFAVALIMWDNFTIRKIEVNGLDNVEYLDVIQLTGIEYMKNIFSIDLSDIKTRVAQNPILEVESVKRILPSTIEININERRPIAKIKALDKYLVINNECITLGVLNDDTVNDYMFINGVTLTSYQLGDSVNLKSTIKIEKLRLLLSALEEVEANSLIKEVDIELTENIKLYAFAGYEVHLGNIDNIKTKCAWVKTMIPKLIEKGETDGILYITNVDSAHFIASE